MVEQKQIRSPQNQGLRQAQSNVMLTPKDVMGILRRHILLIFSLTILGLAIGAASFFLVRKYWPQYTAETYIKVLPPAKNDPMMISEVQVAKDLQYGYRQSIANLIKQQSRLSGLLDRDKIRRTKWFASFGDIQDKRIKKAVKKLKNNFGANALRDAEFVQLSMTCGDAEEAALIVNEMQEFFITTQGNSKKEEINEKLKGLNDQRRTVQNDLDIAEKSLDEVRKTSGFTDLSERSGDFRSTIEIKLSDLEVKQNELGQELQQIETGIKTLESMAVGPINEQIENQIERDPVMITLAEQLVMLEAQLAGKLTKFGENHKIVRETQELISETKLKRDMRKAEIAEQTRQANLKNAQDQLVMLQSKYEKLESQRLETDKKKQELDLARAIYEQRSTTRDERQKRLDEIKAAIETHTALYADPETPKVQMTGLAPAPLEMSAPLWYVYFPGGTMLGLMLGIGLAFLIELASDLVRLPRDVDRYLHIPLLGVIPDADEDDYVSGSAKVDLLQVVRYAPYSLISESYRRFRTNLKLSIDSISSKVFLVTSGSAKDGKTSTAVNLATTFISENKKVLLIDVNFWRPKLHTVFPNLQPEGLNGGQPSEFGLSTLLNGLCQNEEVIRPTGIDGLDVIDAGPLPSNPAELLGGVKMQQLLKQQRENYDYVIVDGPPILLVSDVKALARHVDASVLIFNAGTTKRGAALRTIRELREVNAEVGGCVLFGVKSMKGGYFSEQYKSYQDYQKAQVAHSI